MALKNYEAVIGIEIHVQLLTKTKIFCGCSTKFGNPPNSNVCPVCLGHPGVLPVLNRAVVDYAVKMGLATGCAINRRSILARKNYFYPDLPKGYQISQFDKPLCEHGAVSVRLKDGTERTVRLTRIHIEEDAGKSIHDAGDDTKIDVNRCGVPLIEIVSEPDIRSGEEAAAYVAKMRQIVRYLRIGDGNMEEGSLRCDANVSVRPIGSQELGTKTEIKNMNSFKSVERAIGAEIGRQLEVIEDGGRIVQQTLLWDADNAQVKPMRSKEEAHDYRYFPDPDLLPVVIEDAWLKGIVESMPELPEEKFSRFREVYSLPAYDAEVLTQETDVAEYFENVCSGTTEFKAASNWVMGEVMRIMNEQRTAITDFTVPASALAGLINEISAGTVSGKMAKEIFAAMLEEKKSAAEIIRERGLVQISDAGEIEIIVRAITERFPAQLAELREGKEKVFGFFVGQVMKETKGKANPQTVNGILKKIVDAQ